VHLANSHDLSYMPYRNRVAESTFNSYYHELSELESNRLWVRWR